MITPIIVLYVYTCYYKRREYEDKDLLKLLLQKGWKDVRQRGSHHRLKRIIKLKLIAALEKMYLSAY